MTAAAEDGEGWRFIEKNETEKQKNAAMPNPRPVGGCRRAAFIAELPDLMDSAYDISGDSDLVVEGSNSFALTVGPFVLQEAVLGPGSRLSRLSKQVVPFTFQCRGGLGRRDSCSVDHRHFAGSAPVQAQSIHDHEGVKMAGEEEEEEGADKVEYEKEGLRAPSSRPLSLSLVTDWWTGGLVDWWTQG